jgi:GNAT superfamily N-acetyltransferase
MTDGIEIHELGPGESVAAQKLILRILNGEYAMAFTLAELPDLVDIHGTYRSSGAGNFWVASIDGIVAGCIGVLRLADDDFELRRMYVDPAFRGRQIAQRLLDLLLDWSAANGVGHLYLETNEQWKAAHHIYEKHGFTVVGRDCLPPTFPVVRVATGFYRLRIGPSTLPNPPTSQGHAHAL